MMVPENYAALQKMINTGDAQLIKAFTDLAEVLGGYGFEGEVTYSLMVTVKDKDVGGKATEVKKGAVLAFDRR